MQQVSAGVLPIEPCTTIDMAQFTAIEMRVGTIITATINEKARKPAYVLNVDFGDIGTRQSSAQLVDNYTPAELVGRQIVAVMNLKPRRVAGVKSEVLVLAAVCFDKGTVLLHPGIGVSNGTRIA